MSNPESLGSIALSDKAIKKIGTLAWPKGAIMRCSSCLREKTKTPEEMEKFLKKWPICCQRAVDVRPL